MFEDVDIILVLSHTYLKAKPFRNIQTIFQQIITYFLMDIINSKTAVNLSSDIPANP